MKVNHVIAGALVVIAVSVAYLAQQKASEANQAEVKQQQVNNEIDRQESVRQAEAKRIRDSGKKLFGR